MLRGVHRWGLGYVRQRLRVLGLPAPQHVMFCVADHFEPFGRTIGRDGTMGGGLDGDAAMRRVIAWCKAYRHAVAGARDDDGLPPRHTFFYPWDEYDPRVVDVVGQFCAQGFGEAEVHLHHRADTAAGLRARLVQCRETFAQEHGLLGRRSGTPGYAFVHGNWALCNSRPDGDWCGVAQELAVLRDTGCYLDCTFPSAPSPTQPRVVNRIYYGGDPVGDRCGHRCVGPVRVGGAPAADGVLMVQGPLGFSWRDRHAWWRPRLENGEVTALHPLTLARLTHWCRLHVHVAGRPDWLFVKLHTHGLDRLSQAGVTGDSAREFHGALRAWCHASGMQLHYVAAREMYNIVKAAEAGEGGNPAAWRDHVYAPPPILAR